MADPLNDPLAQLMQKHPAVTGAAFTDMDGEDIAVMPRSDRETLRLCAAYNGIALRRLSTAEKAEGRGAISQLVAQGTDGAVISRKVGDEYQLVVRVDGSQPVGSVMTSVRIAARALESAI